MHRKSLALLAVGLVLMAVLLVQMTVAVAAPVQQASPATPTGDPLPQPMRIQVHRSIPLTISLAPVASAQPLTSTRGVTPTGALTATGALTNAAGLTETATAAARAATALINEAEGLTRTAGITAPQILSAVPVTLVISIDSVVSNTLTTTVPASVTLHLPGALTRTLSVSVTVAPVPDGEVVIELLPPAEEPTPEETSTPTSTPTATPAIAATAAPVVTTTATVTATAPATVTTIATPAVTATVTTTVPATVNGLPVVSTTASVTANIRSGPATTFDIVTQVGPGAPLGLVAVSQDGQWYLLSDGAWIASFLVTDQPADLPIATQEIIDQVNGVTAPTPAATPVPPAATAATSSTVTTDADLRAGPGTEFPIIGGTIAGQAINIVGRNADSTWFRLDNTGWVFGELVANAPAPETLPVVNADGTPVEAPVEAPATTPTSTPGGSLGGLLPTPTPQPAGTNAGTTAGAVADTGAANYLASAQEIVVQYDGILTTVDGLIRQARQDATVLADPNWANRVNAAVALLRRTSATVGELQAPAGMDAVQQALLAAATQYTTVADTLTQVASTGTPAQLGAADSAIEAANTALTAAETAITQAGQ